jgi:hypothetical protein
VTATQITAALRACAAGFYAEEAGTELLISHDGFLDRPGLIGFADTFASVHDGTPMAQIDWQSLQIAWREGQLALPAANGASSGSLPASPQAPKSASATTLPGLDDRNLELVTTAIRHAAGRPPSRP